jgi:transcriptional regulator with XRE-family HTH domain
MVRSKLQELRKKHLTQEELAKKIGCTTHAITRAENGHSVSLRMGFDISDAIGYNIDPTERVRVAFQALQHVSLLSVKQAMSSLGIEFDPQNLF